MVKVGDKYKEYLPSWIKGNRNKTMFFSYTYEVIGFKKESNCTFAECIRVYPNGKTEKLGIDIGLFKNEIFYKKVS